MKAIETFLAAGLCVVAASPACAEDCVAESSGASGQPAYTHVDVNLESAAALDRGVLPDRSSGLLCPRPSIVPRPNDVRALIEWGVAFGVVDEGSRMLWIWARHGQLRITVDDGPLSASEAAAVEDWRRTAQARFAAALREHRPGR